jgi:hypothetical protein
MAAMTENKLALYQASFPDIPGWFCEEAMLVWDFLLSAQTRLGITGDFFEIGVYRGRSAVLGALYLEPQEWCVLLDMKPIPEAAKMIETFRDKRNKYLCCLSNTARGVADVRQHFGSCRWIHIDAEHTCASVLGDLALAADLLCESGIICLDDFFSFRYPQVTAAVYKFLFERQPEFQLVFAGSNKGYICRSSMFRQYDEVIRNEFVAFIEKHDADVQLNRSSYASDGGCFTISYRQGALRLMGLDSDINRIVF